MIGLSMGFSAVDITPDTPVTTVGFARGDDLSRGVLDRLVSSVSYWADARGVGCLVCVDHIGFSSQHARNLRDEIAGAVGTSRERVMLCFSHTHSAPNDSVEAGYYRETCKNIVNAALAAQAAAEPVLVGGAVAEIDIGANRRGAKGECDRRGGAIVCRRPGEKTPCLIILRLTAHANSLKADNYLISADYFGAVRELFSSKFSCPVMVTQGASGNVAPRFFHASYDPIDAAGGVNTETALSDMARAAYEGLAGAVENAECADACGFDMYSRFIDFTADVPDMETARGVAREARDLCGINGEGWLAEVERLNLSGVREQIERVELQYFKVGDICFCGVPNEIMCEFALRSAEGLGEKFFLSGYTNGCSGYFPTEAEFDEGGFEVYWAMLIYYIYHGRVFPLRRDSASGLINFAVANARV